MSGSDLLVMVPTRGRKANCERLLAAFRETADPATDILFILDPDDTAYEGMEWGDAPRAVLDPRAYLSEKLNKTAEAVADSYDALMWLGDDCVPRTPGWDRLMLAALEDIGGSGWVYPDDKRRQDVPEHWMVSSDVVRALGWFANPRLGHFYIDNSVAELGKRSGLIRYCPEAVIEHLHYSVSGARKDRLYSQTEKKFGTADLLAFRQWQADVLPLEVSVLRRNFSPDVAWVLAKVLRLAHGAAPFAATRRASPSSLRFLAGSARVLLQGRTGGPVDAERLTKQQPQRCAQLLTRPGWHGSYHTGHRKCIAAAKRAEARQRDEKTQPERRRAARAAPAAG